MNCDVNIVGRISGTKSLLYSASKGINNRVNDAKKTAEIQSQFEKWQRGLS